MTSDFAWRPFGTEKDAKSTSLRRNIFLQRQNKDTSVGMNRLNQEKSGKKNFKNDVVEPMSCKGLYLDGLNPSRIAASIKLCTSSTSCQHVPTLIGCLQIRQGHNGNLCLQNG